jgi:hypothetical protein
MERPSFYIRERVIEGNTVRCMAVEHYQGGYENNWHTIQNEIVRADVVIPEYFPPEFSGSDDPLLKTAGAHYAEVQVLFHKLPMQPQMQAKSVVVLDPYFDRTGIYARVAGYGTAGLFGHAVGYRLREAIQDLTLVSRRDILKGVMRLAGYGSGFLFGTALGIHETELREAEYRRLTVAQRLQLLCQQQNPPRKTLLIYPPAHIEGIVKVLDDGENLRRRPPGDAHDGRVYKYEGTPPQWTRQL